MRGIDLRTWTLVSPLLDEALDLAPGDRAAFLARLRTERPHVADEVARLLLDHDAALADGFLESSPLDPVNGLAGVAVGAYELEVPLGSGGMGTV